MTTKKTATKNGKRRYITLRRLANAEGSEVWMPGSEIWLDDIVGPLHIKKGSVQPADETELPAKPKPKTKINEKVSKEVTSGNADSSNTN